MAKRYQYLDAAQLIKHMLGLTRYAPSAWQLLYLYYDVPGSSGVKHAEEIKSLADDSLEQSARAYRV
jgi:hypothetical protein